MCMKSVVVAVTTEVGQREEKNPIELEKKVSNIGEKLFPHHIDTEHSNVPLYNSQIARFIIQQPSEKDNMQHRKVRLKHSTVIIYNRINKSGSTTMISISCFCFFGKLYYVFQEC